MSKAMNPHATSVELRKQQGQKRGPKSGRRHGGARFMAGEKPADFKGTMLKLIKLMGRFKFHLFVIFLFAIGSQVFSILGPKVMSTATTELFNGVMAKVNGTGGIDYEVIARILAMTLVLYLGSAACSWVQSWLMASVSQRTCYELRRMLDEKIDRMPFGYFERTSAGDTLSRITNDVDTLGQSLNQGITQLITSVVTLVGVTAMMFYINWVLALITLCIVPISAVLIKVIVGFSQKHFYAQQHRLGALDGQVEETFSGHVVVKAFGQEQRALDEFNEMNDALYDAGWKAQFLSGLMRPVMAFVGNLGYVVVAVTGSIFAAQGIITVGDIQAYIQYVKNFTQPIEQLAQVSNTLQQMAAAAERIFHFLGEEDIVETGTQAVPEDLRYDVDFDHVRFGYDTGSPVIKDFSAHVDQGQTVALVGPTGAGKTTMVKLLMRFYDVQGGAIRIGGTDIREFSLADVRGMFGMVLQDTWLFKGTIRENIRYGRLDATDEEVEAAAKVGCAHHFIETLPGGYDFVISEDASNISQGQRQLLTIARAILSDRAMLILDEATSSVDTLTEERIQEAMGTLMEGRTSFVIAHRLSTIANADLILVMRDGDIVEQGTHEELLVMDGFYADLYNSQFEECVDALEE